MTTYLKKQYDWFLKNHETLKKEHLDKYLVISDYKIVGSYDVESEAYSYAVENFGLGNFIIQQCVADLDTLIIHYSGPVFTDNNHAKLFDIVAQQVGKRDKSCFTCNYLITDFEEANYTCGLLQEGLIDSNRHEVCIELFGIDNEIS